MIKGSQLPVRDYLQHFCPRLWQWEDGLVISRELLANAIHLNFPPVQFLTIGRKAQGARA